MKKLFLIPILSLAYHCFGQTASFKEIKQNPRTQYLNTKDSTIVFPVVVTKNSKIDNLINSQIKDEMFQPEASAQSLRSVIKERIDEGLIYLDYEVTFNQRRLLSFSIRAEGCGAHCSSWTTYFNFDLATGKRITINDLLQGSKIDSFKSIVLVDKRNILSKYKADMLADFKNKDVDSSTHDWAISQVDGNCMNSISIEEFSLTTERLEIINNCEFPYAIQSQQPLIELKYSYQNITKFLSPRFGKILRLILRGYN